ncbi:MAG TPA: efflux RND transporter periplasmic adaptor subunit [Membranihabitans sp.]|nr:efflux RND transporter periplasmic adaptor subunit [Membranihabitans sp.]
MKSIWYIGIALFLAACSSSHQEIEETTASVDMGWSMKKLRGEVPLHDSVFIGPLMHRTVARTIESTGRIDLPPNAIQTIHSVSGGYLSTFNIIPGDIVSKGKVLFALTHPGIIEKQRLFLETKAERDLAQKDYNRKKDLWASRATSAVIFEEAEAKLRILEARYQGLQKELEMWGIDMHALAQGGNLQSDINVVSPVQGIVDEIFVHPGQMVSPDEPLIRIVNRRVLHLELQILARHASEIKKGQKVTFSLPGRQDMYTARVLQVNPQLDSETGTLNVHAHPDDVALEILIPGVYVQAKIELDSAEVVGLPQDAIVEQEGVYYAYGVSDEYIEKLPLTSVERLGNMVVFDPLPYSQFVIKGAYYME